MNATTRTRNAYTYELQQFSEAFDLRAEMALLDAHLDAAAQTELDRQQSTTSTAKATR